MMETETFNVAGLAAGLASGALTERMIERELGPGVLSKVLAYSGGAVIGGLVTDAVSNFFGADDDSGSVLDDIFE